MLGSKPAGVVPKAAVLTEAVPANEPLARVASPALDSQDCVAEAELARGDS
jgi:hypothetical protein